MALCQDLGHDVVEAPFELDGSVLASATLTVISANTRAMMEDQASVLGRPLQEEDVEPGTWAVSRVALGRGAVDYASALKIIHATGRNLAGHLESYDMILSPTMAAGPARLGVLSLSNPNVGEQGAALMKTVGYTQLANVAGNPAMSVPLHWNEADLPIGVQFIGRMNDEAALFRLAGQLEVAKPWFKRRADIARLSAPQ